jgi:hypothetical protein
MDHKNCVALADAFKTIAAAADKINDVLGRDEQLNETVPKNWPLGLSADEFADECRAMVDHYEALARA